MKKNKDKYKHKSNWHKIYVFNYFNIEIVSLDESGRIILKERKKPQSNLEKMKKYLKNSPEKEDENKNSIEEDIKNNENELSIDSDEFTTYKYDQFDDSYFF